MNISVKDLYLYFILFHELFYYMTKKKKTKRKPAKVLRYCLENTNASKQVERSLATVVFGKMQTKLCQDIIIIWLESLQFNKY